jgi:hypothetical protein
MKVIPPGIDASMVQPREPTRRVPGSDATPGATAAAEPVTQVAVSPAARAAAALAATGGYPRSGEAAVVEKIVGTGAPNADFKEQVVGLLVDMMGRTRLQQLERARGREAAADEQEQERAERARRAEAAVGGADGATTPDGSTASVAPQPSAAGPDGAEPPPGGRPARAGAAPSAAPPGPPPAPASDSAPAPVASPPASDGLAPS